MEGEGESLLIEFHCPKCKCNWGNSKIVFGSHLNPKDIKFNKKYKNKKVKKNQALSCPECKYEYTMRDVHLTILQQMQIQEDPDTKKAIKNKKILFEN